LGKGLRQEGEGDFLSLKRGEPGEGIDETRLKKTPSRPQKIVAFIVNTNRSGSRGGQNIKSQSPEKKRRGGTDVEGKKGCASL